MRDSKAGDGARRPELWTPSFIAVLALTLFSFIVGQGLNAGTSVYITRTGGTAAFPMMVMCPTFGFGIFFAGLLGTTLGISNSGLFYTVSAVSMIIVRIKSSALMDRVPAIKIFTVAVACGILAYLMLFGVTSGALPGKANSWIFYLAGIPYGICLGLALPLNQSVAVKEHAPRALGCLQRALLAHQRHRLRRGGRHLGHAQRRARLFREHRGRAHLPRSLVWSRMGLLPSARETLAG